MTTRPARPYQVVTFLTDYGLEDAYVAICHGVLARFAPTIPVHDITHLVPPQNVRRGAAVLAQAVPWFPPAVHLAVVDPGVGTQRRAVAIEAGSAVFVGPDNGLLVPAAETFGRISRATVLTDEAAFLHPVSQTFHGRDVFAPVAGRIAAGTPAPDLGTDIAPADLVRLAVPHPVVADGTLTAEVTYTDRFGNLQLAVGPDDLYAAGLADSPHLELRSRNRSGIARQAAAFAEVGEGELLVHVDSTGRLEIAANRSRAADQLSAEEGDLITVERLRQPIS